MLERVQPEIGQVGRLGVPEDAEDAALVVEFVERREGRRCGVIVSIRALRLRSRGHASCTAPRVVARQATCLQRGSRWPMDQAALRRRSRHDAIRPVNRDVGSGCRRFGRSRAPVAAQQRGALKHLGTCSRRDDTTTRDARFRRTAAASSTSRRGDAAARADRRPTPMPAVSKQHSASVTARPPSAQSCADRISRAPCATRHDQCLQRALSAPDRAAGGTPADACPWTTCRYSLPPSSSVALAEQHDDVARTLECAVERAVGVLDQPDHADDRRRDRSPCRRSRCRG